MAKSISVKIGTYTKDGVEKGKFVKVGVILENNGGEYVLLDPSVSLAGLLIQQVQSGIAKQGPTSVIASVFDDNYQGGGKRQAPQQQQQRQAPAPKPVAQFDDDIPF